MAAVGVVCPALAIRSSVGIELWSSSGPKQPYEYKSNYPREETKNSRSITFSPDGRFFAFSNGHEIKVLATTNWQHQCTLPRPKAFYLKFSPQGNYLCTWELYTVTKDKPEGSPNMFVYDMTTGKECLSIVQKKQTDWEPSWSTDEKIYAMIAGGEALLYDLNVGGSGFAATSHKIGGSRGGVLSLGPGNSPPFVAFYTPGVKGAPSMCKMYKYPALAQNQTISCKSFFQADRVEMLWNKRGTGLLLLTSTEVDKSGASYYGNQALHFMSTKGDSCSVPLSKEGPVHCVKWSPKATEFVVVYGYMPSKAALYNLKCDVIFDFGEGPRNCAYFNAFGNLVVLAGFGNLPGSVEMWDVKKKEKLANIKCPDTTYFEWNPNGEYFLAATTAPRLRIGNGFKIYHYSGALMHETIWPQGQELLGVEWQQYTDTAFTEPIITKAKQEGIKSSQPEASQAVYTPPHLRLMQEGKNPDKYMPQSKGPIPGLPPGYSSSQGNVKKGSSKNTKYNQRQRKDKTGSVPAANNAAEGGGGGGGGANRNDNNDTVNENHHNHQQLLHKHNNNNNGNNNRKQQQQNHNVLNKLSQELHQHQHQQQPQQPQQQHHNGTVRHNDSVKVEFEQQQQQQQHQQQQQQQPQKQQQQQHDDDGDDVDAQQEQGSRKIVTSEKEKKIRNVAKKLSDIKKLKARLDQGETLELNQVKKISKESKFLEELKELKLSAA